MSSHQWLYEFFFVDNIVVLFDRNHTSQVDNFQTHFFNIYKMRFLGEFEWFLGIWISRDKETQRLWLCQDSYIDKLTSKFKISIENKCPGASLPFDELTKLTTTATPQEIYAYQQQVGLINFAAIITCLDVAHAASKLSEYLTNPSKLHLDCANCVLLYLAHTQSLSIGFDAQISNFQKVFPASSNAFFANNSDTR